MNYMQVYSADQNCVRLMSSDGVADFVADKATNFIDGLIVCLTMN